MPRLAHVTAGGRDAPTDLFPDQPPGLTWVPCAGADEAMARLSRGEVHGVLLGPQDAAAAEAQRRSLAHELRGGLALVRGHAELLADDEAAAGGHGELAESLAAIQDAVRRLTDLVDRRVDLPRDA